MEKSCVYHSLVYKHTLFQVKFGHIKWGGVLNSNNFDPFLQSVFLDTAEVWLPKSHVINIYKVYE